MRVLHDGELEHKRVVSFRFLRRLLALCDGFTFSVLRAHKLQSTVGSASLLNTLAREPLTRARTQADTRPHARAHAHQFLKLHGWLTFASLSIIPIPTLLRFPCCQPSAILVVLHFSPWQCSHALWRPSPAAPPKPRRTWLVSSTLGVASA